MADTQLEKPEFDQYYKWLLNKFQIEIDPTTKSYYEYITLKIKDEFEKSAVWTGLIKNLKEFNDQYQQETKYPLFASAKHELDIKPFESFMLKTYKKNIQMNKNWPNEPNGGWVLSHNWFSRIDDTIRTLFVVKYFDGVKYLIEKIQNHCKTYTLPIAIHYEARQDGYYGAHLYIKPEFEIPKKELGTEIVKFSIELQITTQIQEVMRDVLHKYYDEKKMNVTKDEDNEWKWNYKSDEFSSSYLGHILHYVEGMIVETRDKQRTSMI